MRYGILTGVGLAIALLVYGIVRYPLTVTLSPVESVIYLGLFVALLSGYGWLAFRRTQATAEADAFAVRWGVWLGLVLGLCWLIELWAGNLADPSSNMIALGAYRGSILAVPVFTVLAALFASQRTGLARTGMWLGVWSGIISAIITFVGLLLIGYSGALQHDPQTIQQAVQNNVTDIMTFSVADSMVAAINHLWIGPLLGVIFGTAGGIVGAIGSRKKDQAVSA